jgi:hypothetical protein
MRRNRGSSQESAQTKINIPDISILVRRGHFYFGLTLKPENLAFSTVSGRIEGDEIVIVYKNHTHCNHVDPWPYRMCCKVCPPHEVDPGF